MKENEARLILFGRILAFVPNMLCLDLSYPCSFPNLFHTSLQPCSEPQPASFHPQNRLFLVLLMRNLGQSPLTSIFFFLSQKRAFHSAMQHHPLQHWSSSLVAARLTPLKSVILSTLALRHFSSFFFLSFIIAVLLQSLCL